MFIKQETLGSYFFTITKLKGWHRDVIPFFIIFAADKHHVFGKSMHSKIATFLYRLMNFVVVLCLMLAMACERNPGEGPDPIDPPTPPVTDNSTSGITYQLLVYSFADSNGDGIGDFNGIASKLDYLKEMGVGALWLSPIHPASSYHGYDVKDYSAVNPEYGTETDFRNLLAKAHSKGIKIYLDFVLNHTATAHPWFQQAASSEDSPYRDFYTFSSDPQADIKAGRIPMIAAEGASGYDSGQWFSLASGGTEETQKLKFTLRWTSTPTLTVEQVETIQNSGTQNSGKYLYYGDGQMIEFYSNGTTTYSVALEMASAWGVLVRTSRTTWDGGTKYGAPSGNNQMEWGKAISLSTSDPQDILLPGMQSIMFHSFFGTNSFADLNYGPAATCETSGAFKAVTEAADKWIKMGVDGFRLDAIKHIYHNASTNENPTFLKKFYDHCNATYQACGHKDNIYMVGEQFSEAQEVAPYYYGLPAYFEFAFWWRLKDAINNGRAGAFAETIAGYRDLYAPYRSDYIAATKLSNHDEGRAAGDLSRVQGKLKLAASVLLTFSGQPYIYQGEELGYWGNQSKGDEYVRTPMMWNADGSALADKALKGKVDKSMLTSSLSVEQQLADNMSLLNVYRQMGELRATYRALSSGTLSVHPSIQGAANGVLTGWYREAEGQKILVVHNFSAAPASVLLTNDKLTNKLGQVGQVSVNGPKLTLGAYSSVLYLQ